MPIPSWFLLAWSGFAATLAATVVAAAVGGGVPRAWSLVPAPTRTAALGWTLLVGIVLFPFVYGILFELIGRSDVPLGLILGFVHALVVFITARPRRDVAAAARIATIHFVYVVMLAFLYITT